MESSSLTQNQLVSLSKALSKVLRHDAKNLGLDIHNDGFINLDEVLNSKFVKKFGATFTDIQKVVSDNNKKRFELKQDENFPELWLIRAVQGHSMTEVADEYLMTPLTPASVFSYKTVIHGTYNKFLKPILEEGLCRMSRNSIHMAMGFPGNSVISGMRKSCEVVVEVNVTKAIHSGVSIYRSKNDVICSPGLDPVKGLIPPTFFRQVFTNNKSKELLFNQPFDFICVYDFECNCSKDKSEIAFNEIIEFPVVIVDVKAQSVKSIFHTYVRPTAESTITPFCTELTGIKPE